MKIGKFLQQRRTFLYAILLLSIHLCLYLYKDLPLLDKDGSGGALFALSALALAIFVYRIQRRSELYRRSFRDAEILTNNMSGGIVTYALDDKLSILYANEGFYKLIGYTREEVAKKFNNSGFAFMGANEFADKESDLVKRLNSGENIRLEYKIARREGGYIWVKANCHKTKAPDGTVTLSYLMLDITDSKNFEHQLLLEKERYHIATELTNDIIFEYDLDEDTMVYSQKYDAMLGRIFTPKAFSKNLGTAVGVPESDLEALGQFCESLRSGQPTISAEIRILDENGRYAWCHIKCKTIYSAKNRPIKVIGKIVNIDAQKKALEELKVKACSDPLTGLYNKSATKNMIDTQLRYKQPAKSHALMVIDIDNFKGVNDNFGHLVGDEVLINVTAQLRSLFGKNDIVGRIGGDEFVVFMGNIVSLHDIQAKAQALSRVLRYNYAARDSECAVSGSIGISIYPRDGATYNELFSRADQALYKIKKHGKDNFAWASAPDSYRLR